jgi:uncharacterized Zn-finger protein
MSKYPENRKESFKKTLSSVKEEMAKPRFAESTQKVETMSDKEINLSCKGGCGQVFSVFLREMAEHNSEVVCPKCETANDYDELAETQKQ